MRERARRDARARVDTEAATAAFRPPVWVRSLADELDLPDDEVAWRIDRLLPAGGNAILSAAFKSGKTTTVNHLVKCLADGERFLDVFPIGPVQRRIALWNYEVGGSQYRGWLRETGIVNADRVTHLPLRGTRMPLRVPHYRAWAIRWLTEHEIDVWFLDPLARAMVGSVDNENDNTQVGAFLDEIDQIKEEAGVAEVIIPVHTGRGGEERARGATRVDDWPDVAWTLVKNDEGERFFRAYGRDVDVPEGRLSYDYTTRSLRFMEGEDRKSGGLGKLQADLLRVVGEQPGITFAALADALGVRSDGRSGERLREAIKALESQSIIRAVRHGRFIQVYPWGAGNEGGRA